MILFIPLPSIRPSSVNPSLVRPSIPCPYIRPLSIHLSVLRTSTPHLSIPPSSVHPSLVHPSVSHPYIRPSSVFLVKLLTLSFQLVMWLLWLWKYILFVRHWTFVQYKNTNRTNCVQMWLYSWTQVLICLFTLINNKYKGKQLFPKTWSVITALNRWQHMARAYNWPPAWRGAKAWGPCAK